MANETQRTIIEPPSYESTSHWAFEEMVKMQDQINSLYERIIALEEQLAKSNN